MDVDGVYSQIGECGRAQKAYCLAILVNQWVIAFQMVFMVFAGAEVPFSCSVPTAGKQDSRTLAAAYNNSSLCDRYNAGNCGTLSFDPSVPGLSTVASEWMLLCKYSYKISSIQSLYMFGVLVGALMFGYVSDLIGRKKTTLICFVVVLVATTVSSAAGSLFTFATARFVSGFGVAGFGIATFVLGSELVGGSHRAMFGMLNSVFFAIGIFILSIIARWFPAWRSYGNTISLATLALGLLMLKVPESPRWLVAQGRIAEAKLVLGQIARGNGRINVLSEALASDVSTKPAVKKMPSFGGVSHKPQGFSAVCSNWLLFKWTLIQVYSWLANSCVYYGLTMAAGSLSPNLYQNVALSGLAELPGYVVVAIFLNRTKRKVMLVGAMVLGGTLCILIMFIPKGNDLILLRNILALSGKSAIAISFSIIFIHSGEIFPTVCRNTALGICSMSARIGGMLAPFITLSGNSLPGLEYLIFGLLGLTAGLCNMALPETFGKQLPETFDDILDTHGNPPTEMKNHKVQTTKDLSPMPFC